MPTVPNEPLTRLEPVDEARARDAVARIASSETFGGVAHYVECLRFVVEELLAGRAANLTQAEIAEKKFEGAKKSNVRAEFVRIRDKLLRYYSKEGWKDPVWIDIPLGGYVPTFWVPTDPAAKKSRSKRASPLQAVSESEFQSPEILNKDAVRLYKNGQYAEAEPILRRALAIRDEQLGSDHPDTATSLNNLAMLYEKQGRYKEALPLLERALAICEKALGSEHPDTIIGLNNLAIGFLNLGRYKDAQPIFEQALAVREQVLGPEHPDTASSLNNLAMLYEKQGRYKEAIPIVERAVAIREKVVGSEHPDTAMGMNNLAMLYRKEARFAEALPLYKRAVAICERVLGPEHPDTTTVRSNYADLVQANPPALKLR